MTISEWLVSVEESKAMTQTEIAERCGVDVSQVTRWKTDGSVPQGAALLRLIELSKKQIKVEDIPTQKRGPAPNKPKRGKRAA